MAMSPEAQAGYNRILKMLVLEKGCLVDESHGVYGWIDYRYYDYDVRGGNRNVHHVSCPISSPADPYEDTWEEFAGTFYEGDTSHHGITLSDVSCECGHLTNRLFRWEASVSEMAEAVFEKMFKEMNSAE